MTDRPVHVDVNRRFFDIRPIEIHGFRLSARSAVPVGKPSAKQWVGAAQFAVGTEEASPYWVGDLLAYAEGREDWREKFDQMLSLTGLSAGRLHNLTSIARKVEVPERELAPSPAHAAAVAPLERKDQTTVLHEARARGWTAKQTAAAVRNIRRPLILEGQAELEGMYRVVLAAPDWRRLAVPVIAGLPVAAHVAKDAALFLWAPPRLLLATPGVREVLDGWGFTYATNAVWDRVLEGGPGRFLSVTHEHLIVATRGDVRPDAVDFHPRSVHVERRPLDETHVKPAEVRRWIEKWFIRGPFLELFGLEAVDGWSVFGRDPAQWARQAAAEVA